MSFRKDTKGTSKSRAPFSGPKRTTYSGLCVNCLHFFIPPQGLSDTLVLKVGCVCTCAKYMEDVFGVKINPGSQRW